MLTMNKKNIILIIENSNVKNEFLSLLLFLIIAIMLTGVIVGVSYFLVKQHPESEKLSPYECGFEPYEDTRHTFDIHFCKIAILFLVFDVEIMFLIPWSVSLAKLNLIGFWAMLDFLFELVIGFGYLWSTGILFDQKKFKKKIH
jgi:NADH-quinone oxidoreductase subunit A